MKSDTMITKSMLKEKDACSDGIKRFETVFPNGGKYQDVLNACDALDRDDDKEWLIDRFGEIEREQKYTFKAGDRVRIRQWEDMEKEFILSPDGHIRGMPNTITFNPAMRNLCGRTATIKSINTKRNRVILEDWSDSSNTSWSYSTDMLEPTVKEVKRQAKVGEWVKLTKDVKWQQTQYSAGQIIKVDHINTVDSTLCYSNYLKNGEIMVGSDKYVVLEGYDPPVEPAKEQNKYEKMTADELYNAVCNIGMCSASYSSSGRGRIKDCPYKRTDGYRDCNCAKYAKLHPEMRPILIQYLLDEDLDEDAAKEEKEAKTPEPATEETELPDTITINGYVYQRVDE